MEVLLENIKTSFCEKNPYIIGVVQKGCDILYPFVLSLYVLIPPRRNKDYQLMKILNDTNDNDTKYNYIDLKCKCMILT